MTVFGTQLAVAAASAGVLPLPFSLGGVSATVNGVSAPIYYVSPGQINETSILNFADAPSRARRVLRHGDIIWSCVRPNRRSHAIIWQPRPNLIASTGFAVLSPTSVPTSFLYCATTAPNFVGYLENHARGAA